MKNQYHPFSCALSAPQSDFSAETSTPTKFCIFCISCWLGCTPTDIMVRRVHLGHRVDRGCTPVTPGCTSVKYWTPAGAMRKGISSHIGTPSGILGKQFPRWFSRHLVAWVQHPTSHFNYFPASRLSLTVLPCLPPLYKKVVVKTK